MAGLEDLFDEGDYKKVEKGKKSGKTKETKKTEKAVKEKKSIRYPLPVRVRSGHICCNLLSEEYEGKTVLEEEIKERIKKLYPELVNIPFNLVKFSNTHTDDLEKQGKMQSLRLYLPGMEDQEEEDTSSEELEFAPAESEEENAADMEQENTPESEDAESFDDEESYEEEEFEEDGTEDYEDGEEDDEAEMDEEMDDKQETDEKGCWIKLEIQYKNFAEEQEIIFPVSVVVGSLRMFFGEDTESMDKIRKDWTELHPEYKDCLFHYDEKQNLLIPFMRGESEIKGKKYTLPVTVGYLHLKEHYSAMDFGNESVTEAKIKEKYAQKHPEFENALFAYNAEENILFPVMNFKKEDTTDKYSLPMLVRGPGFKMTVEESDFKGKKAVTLQEIRTVIENIYPEFSKERTEMVYDERGFVVPILKGSRKGVSIISDRKNQDIFFVQGRNGDTYRIEQMPYGVFDCCVGIGEADFHLNAEKIPVRLLEDIIAFFKKEPRKEAAVQIFYDMETKEYELYYPEQRVSRCSVFFERNQQLEQEKVLVMDVHSHGCMPAFFSSVDDHDEKGTRLFLVVGRLDRDNPEWKLRAGITGFYKNLHLADIFNMED